MFSSIFNSRKQNSQQQRRVDDNDSPTNASYTMNLRRHSNSNNLSSSGGGGGGSGDSLGGGDNNRNNSSNKNKNNRLQQQQQQRVLNTYIPKIYTYKCYGQYTTTSNVVDPDKKNANGSDSTTGSRSTRGIKAVPGGQCRGISTKFETLYNHSSTHATTGSIHNNYYYNRAATLHMTRIEALQRFIAMHADVDLDDYNHYQQQQSGGAGGGAHSVNDTEYDDRQSTPTAAAAFQNEPQTIFLSPALIYRFHDPDSDESTGTTSNSGESKKNKHKKTESNPIDIEIVQEETKEDGTTPAPPSSDQSLPKTEVDGKPDSTTSTDVLKLEQQQREKDNNTKYYDDTLLEEDFIVEQDWTCYGVTHVEYLSLEDSRTGKSKLIAVAPQNTGVSVRNIETSDEHLRTLTRLSLGWIDILHDNHTIVEYVDDDDEDDMENENKERNVDTMADRINSYGNKSVQEQILADTQAIRKVVQHQVDWTVEFAKLFGTHLKYNCQWLYDNLKDDFFNRTIEANQRIMQQVPQTIEGTISTMNTFRKEIMQSLAKEYPSIFGNDRDNERGNGGGGGRPF